MSGQYNGLQAHLERGNLLIHCKPHTAHLMNLVGVNLSAVLDEVVEHPVNELYGNYWYIDRNSFGLWWENQIQMQHSYASFFSFFKDIFCSFWAFTDR